MKLLLSNVNKLQFLFIRYWHNVYLVFIFIDVSDMCKINNQTNILITITILCCKFLSQLTVLIKLYKHFT